MDGDFCVYVCVLFLMRDWYECVCMVGVFVFVVCDGGVGVGVFVDYYCV